MRLKWVERRYGMRTLSLCAVLACGFSFVSWHPAAAQSPSFDCTRAHLPDEIAICRTPELAELDNVIAAAYAYLKSTRGRGYADQIGIPFWRLRQACQYDTGCIREVQVQAINGYQAAGAPIVVRQPTPAGVAEAANPQSDLSVELHLCRNSSASADKIAHCSTVIAQSSNVSALVTAHNTRGLALVDVGRFSEAVDDFTFVIRREPQIAGFYDNRQNAYRRSGRLDEALNDANKAIGLAPTYSFAFRGRANVYNDMGKYDLAVRDYDEAIQLAPNDGGLFIDRGKIYRTQSKFDQAISDFSHALDLDKKWTAAYRERGLTYKLLGQPELAHADLSIYNRLEPDDPEVILALQTLEGSRPGPPATALPTPSPSEPPLPKKLEKEAVRSGTGFYISNDGLILTNAHVVKDCSEISIERSPGVFVSAALLVRDPSNDLALLKTSERPDKVAGLRLTPRLGEAVEAFGYPLTNILSTAGNFSIGNISALSGLGDDSRYLQISVPVQPGNSGGPLLDRHGNVVGIVSAKLNALNIMLHTEGDIPQNVNFAIKASVAANFLQSNDIKFGLGESTQAMEPPDLAELAKSISIFVECH
jgi:S1-C subfamily serine protease/uncharacterized protein